MPLAFASRLLSPCLAGMAAALLLAGCSNDPNPAPLHEKRPDGSPWLVRHWGLADEPRTLDPQFNYEEMGHRILEPIYDCLLEYNPLKTDPYELQPCLLTEMPKAAPVAGGGVEYLCHLKSGVLYHDDPCFPGGKGREVVSGDVKFAWQRMCDPKVECPIFAALKMYLPGFDKTFKAAEAQGRYDYSQPLEALEVIDDHTFKIHLTQPYPQIVYWMAMFFMAPVPHEAVDYYDGQGHPDGPKGETVYRPEFRWHPVGDGPFQFVKYTPGERVLLVRNPHYITTKFPTSGWPPEKDALMRPLAGHALPIVDEVQIPIFREALPIFLLTRQGYSDGMAVSKDAFNSVVTPQNELTPKYRARGMHLEKSIEPSSFFFVFNMEDPLIGKNKKLRQALACSYNRQDFVDIFTNGVSTVSRQLLPPGVAGFRKDLQDPNGFDLEKARRLIAEAGYPNGIDPKTGQPLQLTMDTTASGGAGRQMAEFEQRCFEQLGVKVQVVENNFARMQEKEDKGAFQITHSGWMADYPDAENFFFLFASKNIPPEGKNVGRYRNPEFDRLFEQMNAMEESPERRKIIERMNTLLSDDCAAAFTFNQAYYSLTQPWAPPTQHNMLLEGGLKYAVLDDAMRREKQREWNRKPIWPVAVLLLGVVALGGYGVSWNRRRHV